MAGRKWTEEQRQAARERAAAQHGSTMTADPTIEERVARARSRALGGATLTPLQQIRPYHPESVPDKSAGAYYLRPEGATIADALIWYPNGAQHDREYDPKGKYSENAAYYQERQRRKGFEYVGPMLTTQGARRLVEILAANRDAEVERLKDEIALCEWTVQNTDRPDVRDQQRRRRDQLGARLVRVETGFDPDALVAELQEIANAQEMASVPPQIMRVFRRMLEQQGKRFNDALIARFTRRQATGEPDPAMEQGVDSIAG